MQFVGGYNKVILHRLDVLSNSEKNISMSAPGGVLGQKGCRVCADLKGRFFQPQKSL